MLLIALSLAAPLASAAPWLQYGYDAARTGATLDPGPSWADVAFRVPVAEGFWCCSASAPLVVEGSVYVLGLDLPRATVIHRVDLVTAEVSTFAEVPLVDQLPPVPDPRGGEPVRSLTGPAWLGSDGDRLFATGDERVVSFDLATGTELWTARIPPMAGTDPPVTNCQAPAIETGKLYLACQQGGDAVFDNIVALVVRIDATSGTVEWAWLADATDTADLSVTCEEGIPAPACRDVAVIRQVDPVSVLGPYAVVKVYDASGGSTGVATFVLDKETGSEAGGRFSPPPLDPANPPVNFRPRNCRLDSGTNVCTSGLGGSPVPTGTESEIVLKHGRFVYGVDPVAAEPTWQFDVGAETRNPGYFEARTFAFDGRRTYVATVTSLHAVEGGTEPAGWPIRPLTQDEYWVDNLVLTPTTLFAKSLARNNTETLRAFDPVTGTALWTHEFPKPTESLSVLGTGVASRSDFSDQGSFSVGSGVIVYVEGNGNVTVLGRTDASLAPSLDLGTDYPAVGRDVTVDLSSTRPGLFGSATSFRADWGDGTVTGWQPSPVLTHAYNASGDRTARFFAANDANQTASVVHVFHVGGTRPNVIAKAFDSEHQNATFFVLGLTGTAIGGAFGLTRLTARRRRLARELRLIDAAFDRTKKDVRDCEAALAERKAHCRGLLLDGKFDETQFAVIERHVEDLA
ncbi:MAG TPA: PQQ-binding-like beta-propeller repeat protein, partial [Candidatus Thermoplasmatota archaeon]|nr:PQQ-binding-like beta-propeller repeat protein [Candidatus Thermoplasmatota archaeon]